MAEDQHALYQRKLLNVEEFAAALGVAPATIRQWVWRRRIGFIRVGRLIRFRREQVDEMLAAGEVPALEGR